jgi:cytochrome c oxidase accessory protein FixG
MFGFVGTRRWVYDQHIWGRFQRLRVWTFLGLHLILFGLPWLKVAGNPALLFDLPHRQLYAFGAIFTPKDTLLLMLLAMFLAFSLFFFTALFGRLWCGYACPQTVLLDSWVRPVERWLEGEFTTRRRRDAGPWSRDKLWRKLTKWGVFALAAFAVAMSFMGFFVPATLLWTGGASGTAYWLVAIFTAVWFLDFTWFREQFCNYLCPYARFQSVMVDDRTLTISYDMARGEPRGGKQARVEGRCIECDKCVNVCPQGIDIRDGFQLECIGCARCIDACHDVMGRFGHESLVRYGSLAQLSYAATGAGASADGRGPVAVPTLGDAAEAAATGRTPPGPPLSPPSMRRRTRVRPRVVVYSLLLLGLLAAMAGIVSTRVPFDAGIARAPGSLFTVDDDGYVRNTFLVRIANNAAGATGETLAFRFSVEGLPAGAEVMAQELSLRSTESRIVPLVVRMPTAAAGARTLRMKLHVVAPTGERVLDMTFKSGGAEHGDGG